MISYHLLQPTKNCFRFSNANLRPYFFTLQQTKTANLYKSDFNTKEIRYIQVLIRSKPRENHV